MTQFSDVVELILSIKDKELLEDLLLGITTPTERQELTRRLEIVKRLVVGEKQHKIAEDLGVGVATVTRGSKELAAGHFKVISRAKDE